MQLQHLHFLRRVFMTHQEGCSSGNREIRVPYYPNNRHSSKRLHVESSPDGLEATKPRGRKVSIVCATLESSISTQLWCTKLLLFSLLGYHGLGSRRPLVTSDSNRSRYATITGDIR